MGGSSRNDQRGPFPQHAVETPWWDKLVSRDLREGRELTTQLSETNASQRGNRTGKRDVRRAHPWDRGGSAKSLTAIAKGNAGRTGDEIWEGTSIVSVTTCCSEHLLQEEDLMGSHCGCPQTCHANAEDSQPPDTTWPTTEQNGYRVLTGFSAKWPAI